MACLLRRVRLRRLRADCRLATNNDRVRAREWFMPEIQLSAPDSHEGGNQRHLQARGLPYAPIIRPDELYADPHLQATGGLPEVIIPVERATSAGEDLVAGMPLLPITFAGDCLPIRSAPPSIGNATVEILSSLGYPPEQIIALETDGVIAKRS